MEIAGFDGIPLEYEGFFVLQTEYDGILGVFQAVGQCDACFGELFGPYDFAKQMLIEVSNGVIVGAKSGLEERCIHFHAGIAAPGAEGSFECPIVLISGRIVNRSAGCREYALDESEFGFGECEAEAIVVENFAGNVGFVIIWIVHGDLKIFFDFMQVVGNRYEIGDKQVDGLPERFDKDCEGFELMAGPGEFFSDQT